MDDQRTLYNMYATYATKSANMLSRTGLAAAAHAPALSRLDQVGIALGTGVATGQVNNLIHDNQLDKKELAKEKDEFRKEKLEDLQATLAKLEQKVREKTKEEGAKVSKPVEEDEMRDIFSQPKVGSPTAVSRLLPHNLPVNAYPHEEKAASLLDLFRVTDPAHPIFGIAHMKEVGDAQAAEAAAANALTAASARVAEMSQSGHLATQRARLGLHEAASKLKGNRKTLVEGALNGYNTHGEGYAKMIVDKGIAKGTGADIIKQELNLFEKAKNYFNTVSGNTIESGIKDAESVFQKAQAEANTVKAMARSRANMELGAVVAPHGIEGLVELAKYPSWRRGAQAETLAIKSRLAAEALQARRLKQLGVAGAVLGAGALLGGAYYNRKTDPIEPNFNIGVGNKSLSPVSAPLALAAPELHESGAMEHPIAWEEKAAASITGIENPHVVKDVGFLDSIAGSGKSVVKDLHSLPWWKKAIGVAGAAGGGYIAHDTIKNMGGYGAAADAYFPYEAHEAKSLMSHFKPKAPVTPPPAKMGLKHWLLGAAGVGAAGYLYNKMQPEQLEGMEKQAEPKSASFINPHTVAIGEPLASSSAIRELMAQRALDLAARKGNMKSLGVGLALGLAAPLVAKGVAGAVNQYQQNRIQNQMLALQQLQMGQQMGMGMNYGYTQPVAIQDSMMYQ